MQPTDSRRYIAVAGNVISGQDDAARQRAVQAARDLGRHLALAGYNIIVYSADPRFIEPYVVEGYIASGVTKDKSIRVEYPPDGNIDFAARTTHPNAFDLQPSADENWEVSFYDSLSSVEGILLMGGGRSTLITGLVGLGSRVTVLPIRSFGGYARNVWEKVNANPFPLTREDLNLLAAPDWSEDIAKRIVALFEECAKRVRQRQDSLRVDALKAASATRWSAIIAVVLFVATAAIAMGMVVADGLGAGWLAVMLGFGALAAGLSGALIRTLADLYDTEVVPSSRPLYITAALGVVAGVFAAMLVAVPQLTVHLPEQLGTVTPDAKAALKAETIRGAGSAALLTAFLTGFALDQFFRNLRDVKLKKVELPHGPGS